MRGSATTYRVGKYRRGERIGRLVDRLLPIRGIPRNEVNTNVRHDRVEPVEYIQRKQIMQKARIKQEERKEKNRKRKK